MSASISYADRSESDSVDPNAFIAESLPPHGRWARWGKCIPYMAGDRKPGDGDERAHQYARYLAKDRGAPILDLGFGGGWFVAACLKLGYEKMYGADFGIAHKQHVREWAPDRITLFDIPNDIGEFLSDKQEQFEFIHLSHIIEHVPKYSLLWVVDSLYWALRRGGSVLLRTPNMEGPCANSSLYVTMSHEYGFAGSNLMSLLDICGFDDVRLLTFRERSPSLKQRAGDLALADSETEPAPAPVVWSESGWSIRPGIDRDREARCKASLF